MKKILVVDDEPSLQELLKDFLSKEGFDVITASNGEEGLKKVKEDSPDLVILDCSMPVLNGYEMLERMRRDPMLINKPVIMLTCLDSQIDEIKGLELGVDDYISKNVKKKLLVARVKAILERNTQSISVNPLTLLSGNMAIKTEVERRISTNQHFSMIYIDLNNFKSFNDKYGFEKGDEVIKNTANILIKVVRQFDEINGFIGHIGGDDFIVIVSPENVIKSAEEIIKLFDESIPNFYAFEDRKQGYIVSQDRSNNTTKFPIMTISLSIISTDHTKITHYGQLSQIAAELKKIVKKKKASAYVIDRRK